MVHTGKDTGFGAMKQMMQRGLVVTGFDEGKATCVFFTSINDAREMVRIGKLSDIVIGEVRQFLFDKTGVPKGSPQGMVIEKSQPPMPAPAGHINLFCVKVPITNSECKKLLPDAMAAGKVANCSQDSNQLGAKVLAFTRPPAPSFNQDYPLPT